MAVRYQGFSDHYRTKDGSGANAGGLLRFTEPGSDTLKSIFNSATESVPNKIANPVTLDDQGRIPAGVDVFLAGQYRLTIKQAADSSGNSITVTSFDPIGSSTGGQFEDYDNTFPYEINEIVLASDGEFYRSKTDPNTGNDPASHANPSDWENIQFEVAANVLSGGGVLVARAVNVLTDTNTYSIPLANSVAINKQLWINLPDEFSAFEPTIQVTGGDLLRDKDGTDTDMILDTKVTLMFPITSDGSSEWSL